MRRIRRTHLIEWVVYAVLLLTGLFLLAANEFDRRHGTTPKQELTVVTGKPTGATPSKIRSRMGHVTHTLRFTVEGQTTEYDSTLPGFQRILEAVRNGATMTLAVSTNRETLIPRNGWVPLYFLSIGPDQVVTYEDMITTRYHGSTAVTIGACALLFVSGLNLCTCYKNRHAPRS